MTEVKKNRWEVSDNPETNALHAGFRHDPSTKAVSVPIYQNTAYELTGDVDDIARLYNAKADGFTYTRIINPTTRVLEKRFAAMDYGVDSLALASGQAATFISLANLLPEDGGANVIAPPCLYGNTWNLLHNTFRRMGVKVRTADPDDVDSFRRLIDDNTIALFGESLSNPILVPLPIRELAELGAEYGIPLLVDNTILPLVSSAGKLGAAISTYSATKYICGHGTTLGGLIVDHGQFSFANNDRMPLFSKNGDEAHGGIVWEDALEQLDDLGQSAYLLKARMTWLRDTGAAISPFSSFQIIQGIETLPLRMKRHCENAEQVADFLLKHPNVEKVVYPNLFTGRRRELIDEMLDPRYGYGPMLMFEVKGGIDAGKRVLERTTLAYHVSNVGDARTLITHPASTTHTTVPRAQREESGISDGSIRLCVGIEHADDIIADLEAALR